MIALQDNANKKADKNGSKPCHVPLSTASATALALLFNATVTFASPIHDPDTSDANYVEDKSLGTADIDIVSGIFPTGYDVLQVIFNDETVKKNVWVKAGAFGGVATAGATDPFDPKDLYRSEDEVIFYCVDLFSNLKTNKSSYTVLPIEDEAPLDTKVGNKVVSRNFDNLLSFLGALNWVLGKTGLEFEDQNWLNPINGNMSAAIQVGIWESLYDSDPDSEMDITAGNFRVTGLASTTGLDGDPSLLDSVFKRMGDDNNVALANDKVLLFHSLEGGQDLIADPVDVPVPATLPLLLSGLLLLGNFGWRRNGAQS